MISRREVLLSVAALGSAAAVPARLFAAAAGRRIFEVPIDLQSRRLVVSCSVNGQGPFEFGIDTGGFMSLIQLDLAQQLHLRERGRARSQIAGQLDYFPLFEANELVFGNVLKQQDVLFAGVNRSGFGKDVVGMLAAGCMTTMDAELDFRQKRWRVYPDGGPPRDGWVRHDRAIEVTGGAGSPHLFGTFTLGGRQFRCLLDTGAPRSAVLFPEAARKGGIDPDGQNWSPARVNAREARVYRSRLPLEVGGLSLERQLVTVQKSGPRFIGDGLIGLPIIQRLDLATEVKPRLLWTRSNGLPAEPERYNMSGLWIDRRGSELFAGEVGKGSPADQAGIATGDRIDGMEFQPLIRRLNGDAGDQVSFGVARGGARRDVTLTLTNYV